MASHSSNLACGIPWTEEPSGYSPWGRKELDTTEQLHYILGTVIGTRQRLVKKDKAPAMIELPVLDKEGINLSRGREPFQMRNHLL